MGKARRLGLQAIFMVLLVETNAQSAGVNHPATDGLGRVLPTYEEVGDIPADKVVEAKMEIAVPRILLDLPVGQLLDLEFKWMGNIDPLGDIMEFYTDGDTAPIGRFSYRYKEASQKIIDSVGPR